MLPSIWEFFGVLQQQKNVHKDLLILFKKVDYIPVGNIGFQSGRIVGGHVGSTIVSVFKQITNYSKTG